MNTATVFAVVFISMLVGHYVGDYLLQTSWQVDHKGDHAGHDDPAHRNTYRGWQAAINHAATYTVATATAVLIAGAALLVPVTVAGFVASQLFSYATHAVIDRRFTLRWLMTRLDRVIPGKLSYYDNGGAPFLDQMAHIACLFVAALLAAVTA